jgi:hypothetical protein
MIWGDSLVLRAVIFSIDGSPGGDADGYGGGGAGGGRLKAFYSSFLDTSGLQITYQGGAGGTGGWGNGQPGMPGSVYFGIQTDILEIVSGLDRSLHIEPNPTRGIIYVHATNPPRQMQIYDCIGRNVITIELAAEHQIVDLSGLTPGVYFLESENHSEENKKLIIIE